MIHRVLMPAVVLALFITSPRSMASEFSHALLHAICVPDCIRQRCCDDYCPKPLPCPVDVKRFCCPDYCPKPLPCPVELRSFCHDDFCPKPFPRILCPPCADLKCPPPHGGQ